MNVEPGQAVTGLLTIIVAVAAWITQRRSTKASTDRQIQNDENATEWQNSLFQQVKDLRAELKERDQRIDDLSKRSEDHWMLLSEARFEIAQKANDAALWKFKYEQIFEANANEPKKIDERVSVLSAALASANDQIKWLQSREGQK